MARIRSLKPEFWTDSKVVGLQNPWARLLFMGSWNFALCDAGHIEDDALALKLKVLPAEIVDAQELLDDVVKSGMMVREMLPDGATYLVIKGLPRHSRTESRWSPRCHICSAVDSQKFAEPREIFCEEEPKIPNSREERKGEDRRGEEEQNPSRPGSAVAESGRPSKSRSKASADEEPREDVEHLCRLLVELMIANENRKPYVTKTWRREARLLLDRDKISLELAEHVLRWCQADAFWKNQIHSMPTFREKFDKLRGARRREHEDGKGGHRPPAQRRTSESFHNAIDQARVLDEYDRRHEEESAGQLSFGENP